MDLDDCEMDADLGNMDLPPLQGSQEVTEFYFYIEYSLSWTIKMT